MAASSVALLVVLALAPGGLATFQNMRNQDSVIQKVIEMLEANKMKVAQDLASEEKEQKEYAEFCDDESTTKSYAIKDTVRKIDDLKAAIEDAEAQIKAVDSEIVELGSELSAKESDMRSAQVARKTEKSDFKATEKTLVSSVDQLEKALVMVKRDAESFLQKKKGKAPNRRAFAKALSKMLGSVIDAAWVGQESTKALKGFIQQEESAAAGDGDDLKLKLRAKAKGKEPEGGGIVQTLEDMKTKAEETLSNTRLEEMKAEHNYQMVVQSLTDGMDMAKGKLSDAKAKKASLGEANGKSSGELAEAKKTKAADELYLKSLKTECETAAEEWVDRQKDAKAEMEAIEKAKSILAEKVKVLVQKNDGYFDADIDDTAEQSPIRKRLVQHLKDLSHTFKSYAFAEMASAAAADPFEKVRGIVEDMIAKLQAEAAEEASQKGFCDEEKLKSGKEKEDKSMLVDQLMNRVDTATSTKAMLADKVKELEAQIAEMDKATSEATRIRNEEHATFLKSSKDFQDGAAAVTEAIRVLKDYYNSVSLLQAGKGRKGPGAASTIVSILENSGEEFEKMYMQVTTDEKESLDAFNKLMDESKVSRVAKVAEAKGAESEIKTLEVALAQSKEDYKMASKELSAVLEYLDKLKPQCEAKVMTYEEKKAKREQEIQGLKEALSILDAPALVQTRKHQ